MNHALWVARYHRYLGSEQWEEKKDEQKLFVRYRNQGRLRCNRCGGYDGPWEVHHRTKAAYRRLGREVVGVDLELLCSSCHRKVHGLTPTFQDLEDECDSAFSKISGFGEGNR